MKKAVFLDRDGVINYDSGFVHKIPDFKFIPRVSEALKQLQSAEYLLMIITNQSGIGRGYYTEQDFFNINDYMLKTLSDKGIQISKVYYCPHTPETNCECRKPKTKFLDDAVKEFDLEIEKSWVIGDKISDFQIGKNAGCRTVLIDSEYLRDIQETKFKDLFEATEYILSAQ